VLECGSDDLHLAAKNPSGKARSGGTHSAASEAGNQSTSVENISSSGPYSAASAETLTPRATDGTDLDL
jgi:hypothetical protein